MEGSKVAIKISFSQIRHRHSHHVNDTRCFFFSPEANFPSHNLQITEKIEQKKTQQKSTPPSSNEGSSCESLSLNANVVYGMGEIYLLRGRNSCGARNKWHKNTKSKIYRGFNGID